MSIHGFIQTLYWLYTLKPQKFDSSTDMEELYQVQLGINIKIRLSRILMFQVSCSGLHLILFNFRQATLLSLSSFQLPLAHTIHWVLSKLDKLLIGWHLSFLSWTHLHWSWPCPSFELLFCFHFDAGNKSPRSPSRFLLNRPCLFELLAISSERCSTRCLVFGSSINWTQ